MKERNRRKMATVYLDQPGRVLHRPAAREWTAHGPLLVEDGAAILDHQSPRLPSEDGKGSDGNTTGAEERKSPRRLQGGLDRGKTGACMCTMASQVPSHAPKGPQDNAVARQDETGEAEKNRC